MCLSGNKLLVADYGNNRIRSINLANLECTTLLGGGKFNRKFRRGKPLQCGIPGPQSVVADNDGNLFINWFTDSDAYFHSGVLYYDAKRGKYAVHLAWTLRNIMHIIELT